MKILNAAGRRNLQSIRGPYFGHHQFRFQIDHPNHTVEVTYSAEGEYTQVNIVSQTPHLKSSSA